MEIRMARQSDLKDLLDIYNAEIIDGVATLDLKPKSLGERQRWLDEHNVDHHPLYVAETDGRINGYVSLSAFREKEAFRSTVELSVYVAADCRRQGIASALMEFILEEARRDPEIHNVVSVITGGNEASRRLHDRFGFRFCGTIPQAGMKFGKFLDIDHYSLLV